MEPETLDLKPCYRHASEQTALSCSTCDRPICGACARHTPVGQRCPACHGDTQTVRRPRSMSRVGTPVSYGLVLLMGVLFVGPQHGFSGTPSYDLAWQLGPLHGFWWWSIASVFLHTGVMHLVLNAAGLAWLGPRLEARYGSLRFALLYLVCGVAGSAGGALLDGSPGVGASGAIFGVVAACWIVERLHRAPIMGGLDRYVVYCLIWTVAMHGPAGDSLFGAPVSLGGHAGGFAAGLALGWLIEQRSPRGRTATGLLDIRTAAALGAVLAVAVAGMAGFIYGGIALGL